MSVAALAMWDFIRKFRQDPVVQQEVSHENINPCIIDAFNQTFTLPEKLMEHITQQPSSPKAWIKVIQTCKHFFGSNPILVVSRLKWKKNKSWEISNLNNTLEVQPHNLESCKIWLMGSLLTYERNALNFPAPKIISNLVPHIYKCRLRKLDTDDQELSFEEFKFLMNKNAIRAFYFNKSVIKYADGRVVPLEVILEAIPAVDELILDNSYKFITSETCKNLLMLPKLKDFTTIKLKGLQNNLDPESFVQFLKNQKLQHIYLYFTNTASPKYIDTFVAVMKEYTQNEKNQQFVNHLEVYHNDKPIFEHLLYNLF